MSIFVITGGAGFIGSHLATHLSHAGHEVRILDDLTGVGSSDRLAALKDLPRLTFTEGDICDAEACQKVCAGADFVLHHAAEPSVTRSIENPVHCATVNINGTINMLQAAVASRAVKRFVLASSCAVYGDTPAMSKHEAGQTEPTSPYASSKLAGELFCRNFTQLHGLSTVALRYFNVYGPGQNPRGDYASVIPRFLTALAAGQAPVIYGDGEQSRDFIFIDDIVQANLCAVNAGRGASGKVFNIGSGQRATLNQLIEKLEFTLEKKIVTEKRPARTGDIKHSRADIAAAAGMLQFAPSVPLDAGLARTLQWYQINRL